MCAPFRISSLLLESLTVIATDALGTATTSAAITVTSDEAPTVSLTGPAAGSRITSPNSFMLTATANSITSTIAKVEFYANNGTTNTLLGTATATATPYSYTWTNVPIGNYTLICDTNQSPFFNELLDQL